MTTKPPRPKLPIESDIMERIDADVACGKAASRPHAVDMILRAEYIRREEEEARAAVENGEALLGVPGPRVHRPQGRLG